MARLVGKVEKESKKGGVPPSGKGEASELEVVEAYPITMVEPTMIESEDSAKFTRLTTCKRRRYGKQVCCRF